MKKKILITGRNGQVGSKVVQRAGDFGFHAFALNHTQLDITDADATMSAIGQIKPDIIINCAAYTDVDKAESDQNAAYQLNAAGPANLAKASSDDCVLLHISTDYVFDGNLNRPYREDDLTNPQTVYGMSKLQGEQQIISLHPRYIILRTAWVYSETHRNFLKTMLRVGREQGKVQVVKDQKGSPTHAADIAEVLIKMADLARREEISQEISGIYHYTGAGQTSWYEYACAIFDQLQQETGENIPVTSISTDEYPTPAKRPAWSVLDMGKLSDDLGIKPVPWEHRVRETTRNIIRKEHTS
ncbi:dTDP-4-dehydrorhamnose reductase [Parvularcula sp. IMCC14364]|uniref:dTDP-4-dehydrorhamnose reductase n=1 Tax=Parvularcula sp. IMCC14364 TaxID=3067902 RepID=UPI002740E5E1|nr:dTDP-4-dehydrorhamnose reductase [Parvularcula sp. IMCC14364]